MSPSPSLPGRLRTLSLTSICIIFIAIALVWTSRQRAAVTITVNSTSDVVNGSDGLCTLREAITAANNNAASGAAAGECAAGSSSDSDIIDLSGITGTINLTGALPSISSSMTITGPGSAQLTVSRNSGGDYRIFSTAAGTITISGLTVTNGRAPDGGSGQDGGEGGGIQNLTTLTMTDVVVTSNRAGNGGFDVPGRRGGLGGGIYNAGTLTMTNCAVTSNVAGDGNPGGGGANGGGGGGIYSSGSLTITNSDVSSNTTGAGAGSNSASGSGGGINSFNSSLTLTGVTINNNSVGTAAAGGFGGDAGGVYANGGSGNVGTMTNCTVNGNQAGVAAGGTNGVGGGLVITFGDMTISKSTISNNTSASGAIINLQRLTIYNSTISGNHSMGIVNNTITSTLRLNNCTVVLNDFVGVDTGSNGVARPRNTIVALNNSSGTSDLSGSGYISLGHNLIGKSNGTNSISNGSNSDQVGTPGSPINPQLGPLTNNGGPTMTHALLLNSPALDAGDNCVTDPTVCGDPNISPYTVDQRGFNRKIDGPDADSIATVDIGAVEGQTPLSSLPNTSTNEDTQLTIGFDPGDPNTITSITTISDNPTLVPNDAAHLNASSTGANGSIVINPAANLSGTTNITVTVNRTGGGSDAKTFMLTVNAVNDAPSFIKGADQTVNEDAGAQTVNGWATSISAGPADESSQILTFQITGNTNSGLFSAGPAISSNGTLSFTPATNANGSATITLVLKDSGGVANGGADTSAAQTFTITVTAVNDAPSFIKGADQTVNEDAGAQTVNGWATSISAGPADESAQTLTFQIVSNSNASLFSAGPAISATGTLTYTAAADANGTSTININLKDNGGTLNGGVDTSSTQSFTITVTAINDQPSFVKGADQTVNNNVGAQTVANWATSISAGPANESSQTLSFQVTGNTNPNLFSVQPAISSTGTLTYTPATNAGGTATLTINLKDSGGTANGGVDTSGSQTFTITITPVGGFVNFAASSSNTTENSGSTTVNVVRTGDTSKAVAVNYATNSDAGVPCSTANGVASPKCDFTAALGTLNFASGETSKTITILISQDSFVEGPETITLTLSNPSGGSALGTPSSMSVTITDDATEPPTNIIDDANMFVRMHYHDFLNREGDQSGVNFWTGQMTNCGSSDLTVCRVNVSGAFFLSIEFQQTGYLVERTYKTAYGDATATSTFGGSHQIFVPVVRANEFLADTQRIGRGVVVLQPGWETVLENNKQAYVLEFVQTSRFVSAFPTTMTPAQFVDKLNQNAGNVLSASERTTAINLFGNAADTTNVNARAQALRQVAEDVDLFNAEFNRAFVLTEYIGYLRRNPNDAPEPTLDYTGYDFWLAKLNQFNGDYIGAEMVKAFISSSEYRQRFGP